MPPPHSPATRRARVIPKLLRFLDLLIWHSNLVHGARLIEREGATRKSLSAHDYAEDMERYSDLHGQAGSSYELRPKDVWSALGCRCPG